MEAHRDATVSVSRPAPQRQGEVTGRPLRVQELREGGSVPGGLLAEAGTGGPAGGTVWLTEALSPSALDLHPSFQRRRGGHVFCSTGGERVVALAVYSALLWFYVLTL